MTKTNREGIIIFASSLKELGYDCGNLLEIAYELRKHDEAHRSNLTGMLYDWLHRYYWTALQAQERAVSQELHGKASDVARATHPSRENVAQNLQNDEPKDTSSSKYNITSESDNNENVIQGRPASQEG